MDRYITRDVISKLCAIYILCSFVPYIYISVMFITAPQISSNRLGCMNKNDRNEINSVDDRRVWLRNRVTFSSSLGKVYGLPAD